MAAWFGSKNVTRLLERLEVGADLPAGLVGHDRHAVFVAVVNAEAPQQATLGGILEKPDAGARAPDRGSDHASAFFDEAPISDVPVIESTTQRLYIGSIDHRAIVTTTADRKSRKMRGTSDLPLVN